MQIQQRVCKVALISFLGLFAVLANAQDDPVEKTEPPRELVKPEPLANLPLSNRGHGVMLSSDGRLRGVAATIDPNTLRLVTTANIDIVFVQNGRIIAQSRTGVNGRFELDGLTPQAVYSVIAKSRIRRGAVVVGNEQQLYSAFSLAVFAHRVEKVTALTKGNPQFVGLIKQVDGGAHVINSLRLTLIPAQDLAVVGLPQVFPHQPVGGLPPLASGATGGSGGGGGGSGGGSGIGAAAAAAAIGAGVAGSRSGRKLASPFMP